VKAYVHIRYPWEPGTPIPLAKQYSEDSNDILIIYAIYTSTVDFFSIIQKRNSRHGENDSQNKYQKEINNQKWILLSSL